MLYSAATELLSHKKMDISVYMKSQCTTQHNDMKRANACYDCFINTQKMRYMMSTTLMMMSKAVK